MQLFAIKKLLSDYSEEEFMAALNWFWNEDVSEDEENTNGYESKRTLFII